MIINTYSQMIYDEPTDTDAYNLDVLHCNYTTYNWSNKLWRS